MKYSILIPYYNRLILKSTFLSFIHHYKNRNDFEVIIAEDTKNKENKELHSTLVSLIQQFQDSFNIVHIIDPVDSFNPTHKFNFAYMSSKGEIVIITNPEIFHESNILIGLDEEFSKNKNNYIVCACKAMNFKIPVFNDYEDFNNGTFEMWYQHTSSRNCKYHFCSAIHRNMYAKVGGFDERFSNGMAYDDDIFLNRIQANNIPIIVRDDLITIHINHDYSYYPSNRQQLIDINRKLYIEYTRTGNYFESNIIRDMYIPDK